MFAKHLFLFSHLIKFPFFSAHNTSRRMDSTSEKHSDVKRPVRQCRLADGTAGQVF
jgi:hypothetical protein